MQNFRFEHTLKHLDECRENINDELEDGGDEQRARKELIKLAFAIVQPFITVKGVAGRSDISLDMYAVNNLPTESED